MTTNADIAQAIKSALNLVEEFRADGSEMQQKGAEFWCGCPFHGEDTASCHVTPSWFKCFGCGEKGDVFNYLGLQLKRDPKVAADFVDILREGAKRAGIEFEETKTHSKEPEKPKTVYPTVAKLREFAEYCARGRNEVIASWNESTNPDTGAVEFVEVRFDHLTKKRKTPDGREKPVKSFWQCSAVEGGFWCSLDKSKKTPLFNRTNIRKNECVVFAEGFKCCKFLQGLGVCSTAAAGGSNNPISNVDLEPLRGKQIIIWPDFDKGGKAFAEEVCAALSGMSCQVSVVQIDGLGLADKDDVVDYFEKFPGTNDDKTAAVIEAVANARFVTTQAHSELQQQWKDELAGTRFNVPFPWSFLTYTTQALLPACVFILVGGSGTTKSFNLIQCLRHWMRIGIRAVCLMCEDGKAFHLNRAIAQEFNAGWYTTIDERLKRPEETAKILNDSADFAKKFDEYIEAPSDDNELTVASLVAWILAKAVAGFRVICVDPITAMEKGQFGFNDDRRLMMQVKKICEKYKCSVFFVTHLKDIKFGQKASINDLAGGKAYERFAQCVVLLTAHDYRDVPLEGTCETRMADRTFEILKARNAPGRGKFIGCRFHVESLETEEIGNYRPNDNAT